MALFRTETYGAPSGATARPERRLAQRFEVHVQVEVSTPDGVIFSTEMINVSSSGFRLRCPMLLVPGSRLVARFQRCAKRRATVAWQRGEEIGCRFDRPLGHKQLTALAAG